MAFTCSRWAGVVLTKNACKTAVEQTDIQPLPIVPGSLELAIVTHFYDMLELSDAEIDYIASQIERVNFSKIDAFHMDFSILSDHYLH